MHGISAIGKRERGFTLLELLVVLAILAMLASMFPLALNRAVPARRVALAADGLVTLVRSAQLASAISGRTTTIELKERECIVRTPAQAPRLPGRDTSVTFVPSTRVTLVDQAGRRLSSFAVFPDGSTPGVRFEISDGTHRAAVMVGALTGRTVVARVAESS